MLMIYMIQNNAIN